MAKLGNVLIAARGSSIDSLNISNGSLLSTWTCPSPTPQEATNGKTAIPVLEPKENLTPPPTLQKSESESVDITLDTSGSPPAKKRRLSKDEERQRSKEIGQNPPKKKQINRSDSVASGLEAPAVIALVVSRDGKHVVAVTGEDKSIRVFQNVSENGQHELQQLNQRAMPKRPCALTITNDDSTIISADKFGDVYSLPLIPTEAPAPSEPTPDPNTAPKLFVPAANEFTIHSERNRKALENQRRQTNQNPSKLLPEFQHTLLLGHVSMLTDVTLASSHEGRRNYILTADRDEHIRISRSIPQTHVIEGFCLGHTEFVSRLCVPSTHSEVLISGGGDDELFVWDWLSGSLLSKVNIASHITEVLGEVAVKPAISSIQHMILGSGSSNQDIIVVTSEGIPALFIFTLTLSPSTTLQHAQTILLPGNALSVILLPSPQPSLLVSVDTIHSPGTKSENTEQGRDRKERERRSDADVVDPVLQFDFDGAKFGGGKAFVKAADMLMVDAGSEKGAVGRLGNLLYGLENLRKREGDGTEE